MRVAIAGGHGKIALELTRMLAARDAEVVSVIRDIDQSGDIEEAGGTPVVADLETMSEAELAHAVKRVDAVVFAAGAGPGSGAERKETVDFGGAVKFVEVARRADAGHYVMISAMGADADRSGDEVFDVYLRAKGRADQAVIESGVPYTVVRPTSLTDDEATGRVDLAPGANGDAIPRADVAAVVAELVLSGEAFNSTVQLTAGDTPVADAVAACRP